MKADGADRQVSIEWGQRTDHSIKYRVLVDPPLQAGQELNYTRRFRYPTNRFPLTRKDLAKRANQPGFPDIYRPASYGDCFDISAEIKELTIAFHFPPNVRVRNARQLVVETDTRTDTRTENKKQTEDCQQCVRSFQDDESMETILEMKVRDPLMNHSYYLLYEPQD
jgi:hypothetical protein